MDLILWRHAQAEDLRPGITDLERQLTDKGRKQAKTMAAWLKSRLPKDARIVASPATRARQTADALKLPYEIADTIAPDATARDLLHTAAVHEQGTVLLIGHQPTLGQAAAMLLTGEATPWTIKKGAIWWLTVAPHGKTTSIRAVLDAELANSR